MHLNTELLLKKYAGPYFKNGSTVLEIGPDAIPSAICKIAGGPGITWNTLNMAVGEATSRAKNSDLTIITEYEYNYPIADNTYDVIISANVMEHVRMFWRWFAELKRIVKPGGHIITVAPISWPFHEAPVDCWRIYPEGMRALYEDTGLTDVFTVFESLEAELLHAEQPHTPVMPWASSANERKARIIKWYNRLLSVVPGSRPLRAPLTASYDLLTIARKEF